MQGERRKMLSDRIDKTVYTKNADGTLEKWYLEKMLNDGTCFLRKLQKPKWIDVHKFYLTSTVYESRKTALASEVSIVC